MQLKETERSLTENERHKLLCIKQSHYDSMLMQFVAIILVAILLLLAYYFPFKNTIFFTRYFGHWLIPLVLIGFSRLLYLFKVRFVKKALKSNKIHLIRAIISAKSVSKVGTFSTGDYRASGSSDSCILSFGEYAITSNIKDFENIKVGDAIIGAVLENTKLVLSIEKTA
ncbi:hypothetical protein [Labilibacter marinus]|uniref:hypothetical protein n=1 Tax=Labilibacter marinus TaxID=1477105 RepID=UPI0009501AA0|nr:hypothetical protein [Labilibacter marinus]